MLSAPEIKPIVTDTGLFVAIVGPSGVGKGTIMNLFKQRFADAVYVLSNTTRAIRDGEKEGEQYFFVSVEEFEKGLQEGKYLEYAQVHQKDYYGVLREPVEKALKEGKIVIRELDIQGVDLIKKTIADGALLTIFIKPENMACLRQHIVQRGKITEEELLRRLESAEHELKRASECDYTVTNYEGRVEQAYLDIEGIILSKAKSRGVILQSASSRF